MHRQHIKPTPITTEDYMHYQASKHTKTDPLNAILAHIQRNPHTCTDKAIPNERDDNKNIHGEHDARNNVQGSRENRQSKYVLI